MEYADRTTMLATATGPVGVTLSTWLTCYPIFQGALQHGETSFRALPHYVKRPVLKRTATNPDALAVTSEILNEVRAAYVELSATCVMEAIESYLSAGMHNENLQNVRSTMLETVAAQFPPTSVSLVARQPCLLSPGKGIFLEGWTRFFAYLKRNDKTIPLLAVDWPNLYERLPQVGGFLDSAAAVANRRR
ncbi:hypothetical protein WN982_40720 [Paraburkholderia sp. IMGN_8]|uniref:hypothetical protein n=1 Tax=Paraburkholderia sp. IMGN_8 TaxID=3136564 RepID=UPI0031018F20